MIWVRDIRNCEQCGTLFAPRREHARFCSCSCRIAWNREHKWDLKAEASVRDHERATALARSLGPPALAGAMIYEAQARMCAGELDLAAEQWHASKVVYFSSAQVFGFAEGEGTPDYRPVDDDHPLRAARPISFLWTR